MALCPFATLKLIPPGPNDPKITARVAILHVDAGNNPSLYEFFRDRSGGVESHFHIKLLGEIEQYRDTAYQADANSDANNFAISIETQGFANGIWTPEQIASIKKLLLWLYAEHDIPLVVCPSWDGSGVGYHILFMDEWAGGPRSCPGPERIKQFKNTLVPWFDTALEEEDMATPEELWSFPMGNNPGDNKTPVDAAYSLQIARNYAYRGYLELLASRARDAALLGAINALQQGEELDVEKMLTSIEERVRRGTAQAIIDAGEALRATSTDPTP